MSEEARKIFDAMMDRGGQAPAEIKREIRYSFLYKHVVTEIEYLKGKKDILNDYKLIKALAALYEVQE